MREKHIVIDGWRVSKLGSAYDIHLGKMLSVEATSGRDLKPYLANRNVQWNRMELNKLGRMTFSSAERERFGLKRGDLLVCEGGEIGRTAIWDGELDECFYQKAIHRLRPKVKGCIEPRFLLHYMKFAADHNLFMDLASQTSISHLTREKLMEFEVVHPISELKQRWIAEILDSVDEQIAATKAVLAKRIAETESLVQDLIPVQPDPGPIGDRWHLIPMAEVVPSADYGISTALASDGDGTPTLRMNNLAGGRIVLDEVKVATFPVSSGLILEDGDVLFNRTNSIEHIGRTSIWRGELERATFASYLVRLNPDRRRLIPEYLVRWLNHLAIQQRIRRIATPGVHQVNINPTSLRRLPMELPAEITQQRKIATVLDQCEQVADGINLELDELHCIKRGLMDDLLTGRVRVPVGESESR